MQLLHLPGDPTLGEGVVAGNVEVPDLDLGAFVHHKRQGQRGGWHLLDLRIHRGILASALGQILFQNGGGVLHASGVVLLFHRQPHFAFLETIQNFGFADRVNTLVMDGADHPPFGQHEAHQQTFRGLLGFQLDVVEASGIPQQHEIAAQRLFVVDVAGFGIDLSLESVLGNATGAAEFDPGDHLAVQSLRINGRLRRFQLLGWAGLRRHAFKSALRNGRLGRSGGRLRRRSRRRRLLLSGRLRPQPREARSAKIYRYRTGTDEPEEPHESIPFHSALSPSRALRRRRHTGNNFTRYNRNRRQVSHYFSGSSRRATTSVAGYRCDLPAQFSTGRRGVNRALAGRGPPLRFRE